MNRLVIFYLLTISYVLSAPGEEKREEVGKLKEVRIDHLIRNESPQIFKKDVYLYKVDLGAKIHVVGNSSNTFGDRFRIYQSNTVVFGNQIIIDWVDRLITLTVDEKPFAFYGKLFSLDNLSDPFSVKGVSYGDKNLDNVSVIKTGKAEENHSVFVALDRNNSPQILFATGSLELQKKSNFSSKEVSVIVKTKPKTRITVHFDKNTDANNFQEFLSRRYDASRWSSR